MASTDFEHNGIYFILSKFNFVKTIKMPENTKFDLFFVR